LADRSPHNLPLFDTDLPFKAFLVSRFQILE
jgi:hypothetical protein